LKRGTVRFEVKLVVCRPVVSELVLAGVVPKEIVAAWAVALATRAVAATRAMRKGEIERFLGFGWRGRPGPD